MSVGEPALPLSCCVGGEDKGKTPSPPPVAGGKVMRVGELAMSPTAVLRRAGPAPFLDSRVDMALTVGVAGELGLRE